MPPRFANHAVSAEVEWPRVETVYQFGPHEIYVFPPSKEHDASLHIDLVRSQISPVEAMSVLNQLLSIASWLDDTFAVLHDGGIGITKPVRQPRQTDTYPSSILDTWCNAWGPIKRDDVRRLIAIYREALNMYRFHSMPYSVLGFYKIMESAFSGQMRKEFVETNIEDMLLNNAIEPTLLRELGCPEGVAPNELADFLQRGGRHAVAHANKDPVIDPDDIAQVRRMSVAAEILQELSRRYIVTQHGIGTDPWAPQ